MMKIEIKFETLSDHPLTFLKINLSREQTNGANKPVKIDCARSV